VNPKQGKSTESETPPLSPGEYRKLVIETTSQMLGILNLEMQMLEAGQKLDPLTMSHILISSHTLSQMQAGAVRMEQEATNLSIVQNPTLVDQDGNPLSRPARRQIEKVADLIVPEVPEEPEIVELEEDKGEPQA
jgi:hypothetical protein